MPVSREKETQILLRREQVAELYVKGRPQWKIADLLGVDAGTISRDLTEIRKLWRSRAASQLNDFIAEQLAKIDALEAEAWEAWRKSQQDMETVTMEQLGNLIDDSEKILGKRVKKTIKTEKRIGATDYLSVIEWCISARRELLGLDAPKQMTVSSDPDKPFVLKVLKGVSMDDL